MKFLYLQTKIDKMGNSYYVYVNKENDKCWLYANIYLDDKKDELEISDNLVDKMEVKVSKGEHAGVNYKIGMYDFRRKSKLSREERYSFGKKKEIISGKLLWTKPAPLFDNNKKIIGVIPNKLTATFFVKGKLYDKTISDKLKLEIGKIYKLEWSINEHNNPISNILLKESNKINNIDQPWAKMLIDGLKNLGYNQKQIEIAFKNVKNLEEYNCFDDKIGCLIENIEINSKK